MFSHNIEHYIYSSFKGNSDSNYNYNREIGLMFECSGGGGSTAYGHRHVVKNDVMNDSIGSGDASKLMTIRSDGKVGIGTAVYGQAFLVTCNGPVVVTNAAGHNGDFQMWRGESDQGGLKFKWNGSGHDKNIDIWARNNIGNWQKVGYIENSHSGSWRLNDFTGQHRCITNNKLDESMYGLIVSSTGKYLNINNNLRATINESLPICEITNINNDKRVFGVISDDVDDNEERTTGNGTFKSIQLKTNLNEKRLHINSVGEGSIWVCNINGNIENGDYITSSTVNGYGQLQESEFLAKYTVAKITCDCNFSLTKIVKQN